MTISKEVSLKRLRKLRDVMASAKKVKGGYVLELGKNHLLFDIRSWAETLVGDQKIGGCGTSACVAGTAGMIPEFRRAGLKTFDHGKASGWEHSDFTVELRGMENLSEHEAFARFFGITPDQAEIIVYPSHYNGYAADPIVRRRLAAKAKRQFVLDTKADCADAESEYTWESQLGGADAIIPSDVVRLLDKIIKEVANG